MKFKNVAVVGALALTAAIALAGCSSSGTPASTTTSKPADNGVVFKVDPSLSGTITAGGSSAQANAETAWTAAFNAQAKGVTINYDKSQGSGGGVTNWLAGSYDFAGSDSPLKPDQVTSSQTTCGADGAVNLPVYLDGVAVIYNLPGVTDLKLSSATIAKIFSLKITTWNDPAIAADNPGATLPATAITTVSRSDGSGTTQNFTNYLSEVQPSIWTYPASNAWPVAGSSAQQGGSGVVNTVKAGTGTIGYADHSAIGDVTAAAIQAGSSKDFVSFSQSGATAAFTKAAVATPTSAAGDLSQKLDYTKLTDKSAYPIPLLSYQIICKTFKDPAQAKITKAYIGFVASTVGQKIASVNAGSAPVPDSMLKQIVATLATVK
ncbi:MAG: phosphate-binding protein [Microbacteriaceae bacterium]|nr:phosphate-binding protein [Microbacteriaceae bacterium]